MRGFDQAKKKVGAIPYLGIAIVMTCIVLLLLAGIAAGGVSAAELHTSKNNNNNALGENPGLRATRVVIGDRAHLLHFRGNCLETGEMNI